MNPVGKFQGTAKFSDDRTHRLVLSRQWGYFIGNPRTVCFIGLNPSTADHRKNDRTISRLISFAHSWGYNGLYIVNLFTKIESNSKLLKKMDLEDLLHRQANKIIQQAISMPHVKVVVPMWGKNGELHGRDQDVLRMISDPEYPELKCFQLTNEGHPYHPLYLPADTTLKPFSWKLRN